MTTRAWYRIALAAPAGPQLVLASGEHPGQAISEAESSVAGSTAIAIDPATTGEIPLGESVGKGHVVKLSEPAPALAAFRWPRGVVPAITGHAALANAAAGWIEHADPGLYVVEAQVDAEHLVDTFLGMLERVPAADNLEVRVLDHYEATGATDVWLTSRTNAKKIIRFLDDHDDELIHNGHVELSIYLRAQKATLRLSEHKTVVWLADNRAMQSDVERWLRELGVAKASALVGIASAPHVHYRLAKSLGRKKLADELYRQRLRKVDTLKPVTPSDAAHG